MTRPRRRAFAGKKRSWVRGTMNGHELAYSQHLDSLKAKGVVLEYYFEPSSWVLGPGCRYNPDFLVVMEDGELQVHEVKSNRKGTWFAEDDARAKLKAFADKYWMLRLVVAYPSDRTKTYWKTEEIG